MTQSYIAAIDIGKTNKKVLIFDLKLNVVDTVFRNFDEYPEDGIVYEDLENMTFWIKRQIKIFAKKYHIKALSITTHGATAFAIEENGKLAIPPVAYTTIADEKFRDEFYQTFGSPQSLKQETGTSEIGSLVNIGKLIFYLQKNWPDKWKNVWKILNMPQYFGYLFTGNIGAEATYIGCHTYLYDPKRKQYSSVAEKLGILDLLPDKISNSWETLGMISSDFQQETNLPEGCLVTMGIHDSNASLLPYLVKGFDNFVLNSTGTWCVAMHPTDTTDFSEKELDALVFYNLNVYHEPVKTSIFKGGLEFETYIEILKKINGEFDYPIFDEPLYRQIIKEKKLFILPSIDQGVGIFPNAKPKAIDNGIEYSLELLQSGNHTPEFFNDAKTALAVLNISLAIQTFYALNMTGFNGKGTIFIEGGFRKNTAYIKLLGVLYPDAQIALTKIDEATALGAAILAKAAIEDVDPKSIGDTFTIATSHIKTPSIEFMDEYRAKFDRLIS